MESFQVNKFVGAFLASILLLIVINGIGNLLVPEPGSEDHGAVDTHAAGENAAMPAEDVAGAPPPEPAAKMMSLPALLAAASVDGGRKVAKKCTTCHSFDQGGANKVGPNLWGVVGAKVARRDDFRYSKALAEMGGEWGYLQLFGFLTDPKAYAPGTKMMLKIKKPTDRANLIVYLRSLSENPLPLPMVDMPAAAVEVPTEMAPAMTADPEM
ncbi:MAG: cytochrome c family protein [Rhodospirillales bacterium]|nr:cytochrome c family protein [Rhodospirillales bacterium]